MSIIPLEQGTLRVSNLDFVSAVGTNTQWVLGIAVKTGLKKFTFYN